MKSRKTSPDRRSVEAEGRPWGRGWQRTLTRYIGLLLFFLLWEVAARLQLFDTQFLPPFTTVIAEIFRMFREDWLFTHLAVSLWRVLMGLLVAVLIALPAGIVLGSWRQKTFRTLQPLLRFLCQVNPFSLLPLFIIFFGIGEVEKVAVVAWVCLWPILFNTVAGAASMDGQLIRTAHSMNASRFTMFRKVLLPGALSSFFTGLRLGVEMSFFMIIAGEMVGAAAGLGWLLHNSAQVYQIPRLYASGFVIILLGMLINSYLRYLQRRLFYWREKPVHILDGAVSAPAMSKRSAAVFASILLVILLAGSYQTYLAAIPNSDFSKEKTGGEIINISP